MSADEPNFLDISKGPHGSGHFDDSLVINESCASNVDETLPFWLFLPIISREVLKNQPILPNLR